MLRTPYLEADRRDEVDVTRSDLRSRLASLTSSRLALASSVDALRDLRTGGVSREFVRSTLEDLRTTTSDEPTEDRILEILDFVTGYCRPELDIWRD